MPKIDNGWEIGVAAPPRITENIDPSTKVLENLLFSSYPILLIISLENDKKKAVAGTWSIKHPTK